MDDVNSEMVNDFAQDYQLITDDGDPIETSTPAQPASETQPNGNNPIKAQEQPTEQPQDISGFEDQFFIADPKGNKQFDANKALEFLNAQTGFQSPQNLQQTVFNPAPAQPAQPQQPADTRQPWEIQLEEERKLRESVSKPLYSYKSFLNEALEKGYQGDMAIAYADQLVEKQAEEQFRRTQYESQYKKQQEDAARQKEQQELATIEPRSRVNIAKVSAELGGPDKLNDLVFGKFSPEGKVLKQGYGLKTVEMLFQIENQGKQLPTNDAKAMGDLYAKWWTKFSSNENNLRYVVDAAKIEIQRALFPQIVNHINSVKQTGVQTAQRATQAPSSNINRSHGSSEPSVLDRYFNGPTNGPDII